MLFRRRRYNMDIMANIRPTSKIALKMQCLAATKYNIDEATKLYDFLSKDIDDLPTFDVVPPTTMQQIRDGAIQTFKWVNENQDTIMNWVGIARNILGKSGNIAPKGTNAPIPPINK